MSKKIHLIVAARPNFMKIAPLYHALKAEAWANPVIVHTGQHYDINMSDNFFTDLKLPEPDIHLEVGSGTHAEQTGRVMIAYEEILKKETPELTVVVGDVNSTIACAMACAKLHYPADSKISHSRTKIAHLEAGLRSFDRDMPEEINRILTDTIADVLWTPSIDGDENLKNEGVSPEKIVRIGNIMIDSLEMMRETIELQNVCEEFKLTKSEYAVVTLHRPSNVDNPVKLKEICTMLNEISELIPIVFPLHPRTKKNLEECGFMQLISDNKQIVLVEPQSYIRFMNLVFNCRLVITDSGGIQEETTYIGTPCLTIRPNTERPITITQGTNQLCKIGDVNNQVQKILSAKTSTDYKAPDLWDGHAADRAVQSIKQMLE